MPPFFVYVAMGLCFSSPVSPARARDMRSNSSALSIKTVRMSPFSAASNPGNKSAVIVLRTRP